ncbi:thioredoxin domain-containing protein 11 [Amyelois transitella]|uniref:thioredoxin domain-containing protein 11 n=1 Tax=Amyelois transitella TaxID=680683 RepID=UPI002990549E|nr:thioredoxin domain-containing protein 11 [Amyelois transitella]
MFPTVDTEDIVQGTSLQPISVSSDAQDSSESTQSNKQNNKEITLNMLIKEMVFCIALALTTYGALHNTPTKISKHPQAVRFFGPDSVVTDWFRGQLSSALTVVNKADISFVMYYAPWDAESQYVRGEFEKAAIILNDRVHFAAINCWNPGSECRLQHNKIPSWPILMAYKVNSQGVLYKGPRDAHSIVKFLELIIRPLNRVSSTEELVNLLSICDAVAVGFTPLADTSRHYNVWYTVALKAREFDTVGEICFAVVTSEELALDLGVETVPNARLMLWNDTMDYISDGNHNTSWNDTSLLHWVLENFTQPVARVIPMWKKAFSFQRYVDGNPILILFTPLNPLYEQLPSYALLREVAMEYHNCHNNDTSQWTTELLKLQQVQRLLYEQKNFLKFCQDFKYKKPIIKRNRYYRKGVVSQNNKYPWINVTQKYQKNRSSDFLMKKGLSITKVMESSDDEYQVMSVLGLLDECTKELPAERAFYDNYEKCSSLEDFSLDLEEHDDHEPIETTMLPFEGDHLAAENLLEENVNHFCKLTRFAYELGPPVVPSKVPNSELNVTDINGLSCEKNFSLHMLAVDSVTNHHFAEFLGIDVANKKDKTTVVILDSKHESQYILSEEYSAKSIREFIYNFTHKKLKRSLRTHVEDASHTHYYGSDGNEQMEITNDTIHIVDLTTRSFRKMIKTPGVITLVVVCGGPCYAHVSRALLAAARLLRAGALRVAAARLDARAHDLPWPYTPARLPAVFVFPVRDREARSRSYPVEERVSASGLVSLALRALQVPAHLRVRLAICQSAKGIVEKKTCLKDIKEHCTTIIGSNLKYWRRSEHRELKDALYRRLQHLHQVSLDLSLMHVTDLTENSMKQQTLLNSLSLLANNWDIDVSILNTKS